MKIEFDIEEKDSIILLDIIKKIIGQTNSKELFKTLTKIAWEIESDLKLAEEIFIILRNELQGYTNGNPIYLDSNMTIYLGISENFITRQGGLESLANSILRRVVKKYKPHMNPKDVPPISLTSIKKCKIISDVQNLIQSSYEKI